ncbi:MAG: DoxX family membrane protein [Phycisphaerales bacterium]|nr:DoxX family membrane protein [Phycisphaerales bacterium]
METGRLDGVYVALRLCYGLVPIVAGADKFLNLLTDWSKYLPGYVPRITGMEPHTFMMIVGVIEIIAGVVVLAGLVRLGAAIVALWLVAVALNAAAAGFLDIAVRDLVMALGAYTLMALAAARGEAWVPGSSRRAAA